MDGDVLRSIYIAKDNYRRQNGRSPSAIEMCPCMLHDVKSELWPQLSDIVSVPLRAIDGVPVEEVYCEHDDNERFWQLCE